MRPEAPAVVTEKFMASQCGWCSDGARVASPGRRGPHSRSHVGSASVMSVDSDCRALSGVPGARPEQEPTSGASALSLRAVAVAQTTQDSGVTICDGRSPADERAIAAFGGTGHRCRARQRSRLPPLTRQRSDGLYATATVPSGSQRRSGEGASFHPGANALVRRFPRRCVIAWRRIR